MHRWDRFIKNTAEILSPLHELTARTTVSAHEFLTPDYKVQRTIFGDGFKRVEVIVNGSSAPFTLPGANAAGGVVLPAYGFLVTSPTFLAFCALETSETRFSAPTLFTSRTVDDRPFRSGSQVRVFHGFGDRRFTWAGKTFEIAREGEITLP